jgi:salicylate hydroxylase
MPAADGPILIAGGGIGGLATALALARYGIASRILERNREFTEAGAGIQLGPNGVRVLQRLDVAPHLEPLAGKPDAIRVHDGPSGARLADLPLGQWIVARHGTPYWVAHRADLQAALLRAVAGQPLIEVVTGFEIEQADADARHVEARASSGARAEGVALVAADGLWSSVRRLLFSAPPLPFSGKTATRTVIERAGAPDPFRANVTGAWLSPDAHVVHYPVRGGADIAVVVIAEEDWPGVGWGAPADREALLRRTAGFAAPLQDLLALGQEWRKWSLYDPGPWPVWTKGRVALLGDAAHPVLPFLAQGGVLALEDAITLAACVAARPCDPAAAFKDYEHARRPRAARVQGASRDNGRIYHLAGSLAQARNFALRVLPPSALMARYDWLYGWRGEAPS